MSNPSDIISRVSGLHDAIGTSLNKFGGFIRCETCRRGHNMGEGEAGRYVATGWPTCCGETMRWWTMDQIDNDGPPA